MNAEKCMPPKTGCGGTENPHVCSNQRNTQSVKGKTKIYISSLSKNINLLRKHLRSEPNQTVTAMVRLEDGELPSVTYHIGLDSYNVLLDSNRRPCTC